MSISYPCVHTLVLAYSLIRLFSVSTSRLTSREKNKLLTFNPQARLKNMDIADIPYSMQNTGTDFSAAFTTQWHCSY